MDGLAEERLGDFALSKNSCRKALTENVWSHPMLRASSVMAGNMMFRNPEFVVTVEKRLFQEVVIPL